MIRWLAILLLCAAFGSTAAFAADSPQSDDHPDLQSAYDKIAKSFKKLRPDEAKTPDLDALLLSITALDKRLQDCIETDDKQLESTQKNLELLGDKETTEASDVRRQRHELEQQAKALDADLKRCTVLSIQLGQLHDHIETLRQKLLRQQFFSREFSVVSAVRRLLTFDEKKLRGEIEPIRQVVKKVIASASWAMLLLGIAGVAAGVLWHRVRRDDVMVGGRPRASNTLYAAMAGLRRTMPVLAPLLLVGFYVSLQEPPQPLLKIFLGYALLLFFSYGLARGVLYPNPKSLENTQLSLRLMRLLAWIAILFTLLTFFLNQEASGRYSGSAFLYLIWLGSLTVASLAYVVLVWMIARKLAVRYQSLPSAFLLPAAIMLGVVTAAASGYRNIASLFFFGTLNSFIVLLVAFVLLRIGSEFFDSLDEGRLGWQRRLRHLLAIEEGRSFPGLLWLRILLFLMVALAAVALLMFVWGSSQQRISSMFVGIREGVDIGGVHLDLIHLAYALLILVGMFSVLPFFKNQLVAGWLRHSNLSRGAREAIQTLVGYALAAVAVLWALSVAGVNFQNLAIVAGALSVGIGFGLQNIVNNFVSGLILLFERPIRRGDWVVVGNTEGHVKDISIRSTRIQTFDRADVIVPNSELISTQVTNWVLSNTIGRISVPVGVAYGSDVDEVADILRAIAADHPEVITDNPRFPIRVLFRSFGDSALNFELRCYIRNIDRRLVTISAINFSIDREFRKAGIEIPFPQRVVHLEDDAGDDDSAPQNLPDG